MSHAAHLSDTGILPARIGCAGWALSAKVAVRFPGQGTHLERYAQIFSSVEINSSFHRSHQSKTYARWAASVPYGFRFSVKLPRRISHELKLREAHEAVRQFCAEVAPLGEKLGCLLLQLPPSLELDIVTARNFFSQLRDSTNAKIVCEPRHRSWFTEQGAQIMRDAGVSCVWADPAPIATVKPVSTPGMLYMRLHGSPRIYYSSYETPFLEEVSRIIDTVSVNTEVWCIFDNTAAGEAVPNALTLMEIVRKRSSNS